MIFQEANNDINYRAIFIILSAGGVGGHSIVVSLVCIYKIFRALNERYDFNPISSVQPSIGVGFCQTFLSETVYYDHGVFLFLNNQTFFPAFLKSQLNARMFSCFERCCCRFRCLWVNEKLFLISSQSRLYSPSCHLVQSLRFPQPAFRSTTLWEMCAHC